VQDGGAKGLQRVQQASIGSKRIDGVLRAHRQQDRAALKMGEKGAHLAQPSAAQFCRDFGEPAGRGGGKAVQQMPGKGEICEIDLWKQGAQPGGGTKKAVIPAGWTL